MTECNGTKSYTVGEDSTFVVLARVQKTDGTYALKADISTITVTLFDTSEVTATQVGTISTYSGAGLVPVFFDTLDTSAIWTKAKDSIGFNLKLKGSVPDADHTYDMEVFITFANTDTQKLKFNLKSK